MQALFLKGWVTDLAKLLKDCSYCNCLKDILLKNKKNKYGLIVLYPSMTVTRGI